MSHAPGSLWLVVDSEGKPVSVGAVKRELEAMIRDNRDKGWKLRKYYNNEYWTTYVGPERYQRITDEEEAGYIQECLEYKEVEVK